MKPKYFSIFLIIICCVSACGPFRGVLAPAKPGQALFEKAEQKYRQADYSEAHALYHQYLEEFPDTALTPAAMMKIGMIQAEWKQYENARQMYHQLINQYPESIYASQVKVEILASYMKQGRFEALLQYYGEMPIDALAKEFALRAHLIAGDAYMALGEYESAYKAFSAAYDRASPSERKDAADRLQAAISRLSPERLQAELDRLKGEPPSGFLRYQQGVNCLSEGRVGDALTIFNDFMERHPEHPLSESAREEILNLTSAAFFEGHTIGCLLPLSGKYETFGQQALRGIELAIARASKVIDAEPPFKLLVRDTQSDPETAVQAVRDLSEKRVAAIIGPMVTASEAAAAAQELGVPMIALTQKTDIVDIGAYVFRNFLTPQMQVRALVKHTTGAQECRRFAVLYPEEAYGEAFLHLFWDELIKHDAQIVGAESYNPDHTDFSDSIKKLVGLYYELPEDLQKEDMSPAELVYLIEALSIGDEMYLEDLPALEMDESLENAGLWQMPPYDFGLGKLKKEEEEEPEPIVDFDAIFIPDAPNMAGLIIPQLRYYDINDVFLLGTNLWHSQKLIDIAGYQIRQAIIPEGFFAKSRQERVKAFVSEFTGIYGYAPGFIEAVSYDSAMMLCEQSARKDVANRPALQKALTGMSAFKGVTGMTAFLETGEADKSIYLLSVSRGRFREIPQD